MKEQFRIGKLAQELGVKRFVIRFWEKEFGINSQRSSGGQRYYLQEDFDQFKLIKQLLYEKGFTIAGAKKILHQGVKKTAHIIETKIDKTPSSNLDNISNQIRILQKQLIRLRELL